MHLCRLERSTARVRLGPHVPAPDEASARLLRAFIMIVDCGSRYPRLRVGEGRSCSRTHFYGSTLNLAAKTALDSRVEPAWGPPWGVGWVVLFGLFLMDKDADPVTNRLPARGSSAVWVPMGGSIFKIAFRKKRCLPKQNLKAHDPGPHLGGLHWQHGYAPRALRSSDHDGSEGGMC